MYVSQQQNAQHRPATLTAFFLTSAPQNIETTTKEHTDAVLQSTRCSHVSAAGKCGREGAAVWDWSDSGPAFLIALQHRNAKTAEMTL